MRTRNRMGLNGVLKCDKTQKLLGCTFNEFKIYLESKFLPGMSWCNHGKGIGKWQIDHIKPLAAFNLLEEKEQREAFHFSNMQPLWSKDNQTKSSWYNGKHYKINREPQDPRNL